MNFLSRCVGVELVSKRRMRDGESEASGERVAAQDAFSLGCNILKTRYSGNFDLSRSNICIFEPGIAIELNSKIS